MLIIIKSNMIKQGPVWPWVMGLEHAKNTSPKSQTHTQRVRTKIYEVRKMPMSRGRFTQDYRGLYLIYSRIERRNHQISSRSGPKIALTRLSVYRPKCAVDCPVDRAKSCKTIGLIGNAGRLTKWVSLLSTNFIRLSGQPIQALYMSIDRPVDRSLS